MQVHYVDIGWFAYEVLEDLALTIIGCIMDQVPTVDTVVDLVNLQDESLGIKI